jgi:hypothetical protein
VQHLQDARSARNGDPAEDRAQGGHARLDQGGVELTLLAHETEAEAPSRLAVEAVEHGRDPLPGRGQKTRDACLVRKGLNRERQAIMRLA